jgi:hypothetical protein
MLIGLSGLSHSGKSTVAAMLVEEFNFVEISFADPIKRICKDLFHFTDQQLWGSSKYRDEPDIRYRQSNGHFLTPRFSLERCGDEFGRSCYPQLWIDQTMATVDALRAPHEFGYVTYDPTRGVIIKNLKSVPQKPIGGIVISDIRRINELQAIERRGGRTLRLKRGMKDPSLWQRFQGALDGIFGTRVREHGSIAEQRQIPDARFTDVIDNREMSVEDLKIEARLFVDGLRGD